MSHRSMLNAVVCAALCLALASPCSALFKPEMEKAKELMAQEMYADAVKVLKRHIQKSPEDGEAYFQLGLCYLKTDRAMEADESFLAAAKISSEHNDDLAYIYREMANAHLQANKLELAKTFYDRMIGYNPTLFNAEFLKQLGYRYLYKAVESTGTVQELFKQRAAELVGQELVDQVFPGPSETDVFAEEYTDADIIKPDKDGGWIDTFDWADMRTGKTIIIEGHIPPGGSEIYYFRGEEYDPTYLPTIDGKMTIPIKDRPEKGPFAIWIQKGKNISATVRVVDEAPTPPRVDLIPPLLKRTPPAPEKQPSSE